MPSYKNIIIRVKAKTVTPKATAAKPNTKAAKSNLYNGDQGLQC